MFWPGSQERVCCHIAKLSQIVGLHLTMSHCKRLSMEEKGTIFNKSVQSLAFADGVNIAGRMTDALLKAVQMM